MAINLQKGQKINIGLSKMSVGLGWTPNEGTGNDFDLDASAFMIDSNRLIPKEEYFIFLLIHLIVVEMIKNILIFF